MFVVWGFVIFLSPRRSTDQQVVVFLEEAPLGGSAWKDTPAAFTIACATQLQPITIIMIIIIMIIILTIIFIILMIVVIIMMRPE